MLGILLGVIPVIVLNACRERADSPDIQETRYFRNSNPILRYRLQEQPAELIQLFAKG